MSLVRFSFSCYTVLLGIIVSAIGTSLMKSHLLVWSFLVLGSLSVCGWLKAKVPSDALVLYFVVSALGRLLFLVRCSEFAFSSTLLQLALLLKLGLAPFQFWVFKVLLPLSIPSLCFFLGPLKVGLLWLLVNINHPSLILASASLCLGSILLWLSRQIHLVLYASGACQIFILVVLGPSFFTLYFLIYTLALLGIYWFRSNIISSFFAFASLGALPPLTMFWAKVIALFLLPTLYACIVLLTSLLSLWPYIRCSLGLKNQTSTSFLHCSLLVLFPCFLVISIF